MVTMKDFSGAREFTPIKLNLRTPVPSDIEIAQEVDLKPIAQMAEELGLRRKRSSSMAPTRPRSSWRCSTASKTCRMESTWT